MAFIVIEGGDGSGKSTQTALLRERLPSLFPNKQFVFTREPGGTPLAEKIRSLILSEDAQATDPVTLLDLFMASRFEHVKNLIAPALEEGKVVVCERFVVASYAYQIAGEGKQELFDTYKAHHALLKQTPDLVLVLDIDPALALARLAKGRGATMDHFESRALDFHSRVRKGYREYEERFKPKHMMYIDASRSIDEVYADILAAIQGVLG